MLKYLATLIYFIYALLKGVYNEDEIRNELELWPSRVWLQFSGGAMP